MNCRATNRRVQMTDALHDDITRVQSIWTECRNQHVNKGEWLFGSFSIVDAMYAPVVSRFHTYGISCDGIAGEYLNRVLSDTHFGRWCQAAEDEAEVIEDAEVGLA